MNLKTNNCLIKSLIWICLLISSFTAESALAKEKYKFHIGNFGLPGVIDMPSAKRLPDGEIVVTQQLHKSLARSGISFQALPRLSFSFRYSGHGIDGHEAYGRINHDRSFDANFSILHEGKYLPEISIGLRDFIGTGWYSSEYIVGTKTIRNFELTAGLGFGRLAGRNVFENPLAEINQEFQQRASKNYGKGGTLGNINWFQGDTSLFYGINLQLGEKIMLSSEYTPDLMVREGQYLDIESPLNFGLSYQLNDYINVSAQYLHGSQISLTANLRVNPARPPMLGGKELAPVPMRQRQNSDITATQNNHELIKAVLSADKFEIHQLTFDDEIVKITVTNTKFRSTAQAIGRVASTLQRFTKDSIKAATISLQNKGLLVATYHIDLEEITADQFNPKVWIEQKAIEAINITETRMPTNQVFSWGIGPYITHRLFNPDLPLSGRTGLELNGAVEMAKGLKLIGSFRKSVLTNLTDNERRSNSVLPRVHSDWPLYDFAGKNGHIHKLNFSYFTSLSPSFYGRAHAGLLEPFFAGIGAEVLFKPAKSPIALGLDIHRVRKRDYDMGFDLMNYEITVGHLSAYIDAGGMFDIEVNAGRYLAGDWGVTTTISRKFGSGWEVGGYATLTDVPFDVFGEGSFDKAIYVSIPIDWIISSPTKAKRRLTLRPITRDGGANLASARSLYRVIERSTYANFKREYGRLWK